MNRHLLTCTTIASLLTACSATAPKELLDARTAYQRAEVSQASTVTPADVAAARDALNVAERSFEDDGDSLATRSYAYVAQRAAEQSVVRAGTLLASQQKAAAESRLLDEATSTAQARTREVSDKNQELQTKDAKLRDAEKRAREAMDRLAAFASIREETRGLVITLPGGVLFETNKAALLGTAEDRLNQVAEALLTDRDATMLVEGHTDSQGNDAINDALSLDRANAVRDYLVRRGVAADRITAAGRGSKHPIADNRSPEGRANNRRVEIVVTGKNGGALRATLPIR